MHFGIIKHTSFQDIMQGAVRFIKHILQSLLYRSVGRLHHIGKVKSFTLLRVYAANRFIGITLEDKLGTVIKHF